MDSNNQKTDQIPLSWKWSTVGEIFKILSGGTPSTKVDEYWGGEIPWITSANIHGLEDIRPERTITSEGIKNSATNLVPKGSIIVVTRVSLGKVAIADTEICFSQDSQALLPNEYTLPKYTLYYLSQAAQNFKYRSRGTTISGITKKQLSTLPFPLPPLPEQQRIVEKIEELFTQLDAGVVELQKAKAQLKRYRQAVLKAAIEGELTREWRAAHKGELEPASELLERILVERRAKWEEEGNKRKYKEPKSPEISNLPELPDGWVWVNWERVGVSQNGRYFPSKEYQNSGVKLLRPGNLFANGEVIWTEENTRFMPESWADEYPKYIVRPNELVMNLTAQSLKDEFLGRTCITGRDEFCLLNQRLARLTPLLGNSRYFLWMFKSRVFRQFVDELNTGSLIQHMFTSQLAKFILPLPPLAEQEQIVQKVERRLSVADEIEKELDQALARSERLRQSILKRAFEGKLVEQGPKDEPASGLLEYIKANNQKKPFQLTLLGDNS